MSQLTVTALIGIAKQQLGVLHEEHGVWHIGLATRHSTLHYNNLFALPRVQDRHTCNRTTRLHGDRIDSVIRAYHKSNVRVWKIVVDFIHLENNVVRYRSFSQQDVDYDVLVVRVLRWFKG